MQIESKKNKGRHFKQDDLDTASSCSYAVDAAKKVISIMTNF